MDPVLFATSSRDNPIMGMEVQLMQGDFGTLAYLNLYSFEVKTNRKDPKGVDFLLEIEGASYAYRAILMEGRQRLLLPEAATQKLIDSLCQSLSVTIYLQGISCTLHSDRALAQFKKLQKNLIR